MEVKSLIHKSIDGITLNSKETFTVMSSVMRGEVSEPLLAAWLTSLKIRTETEEELLGAAKAMQLASVKPVHTHSFDFIDTCGTGGDGKNSINISTLSALTLASMGIKVAKHGNRSVSSMSGSSDILTALGYNINVSNEDAEKRLIETNFTFLFAPHWHPAMKYAANVRKELGFRTIFNLLGPISNPLSPTHQIIGVYSPEHIHKVAYTLKNTERKAFVVCHSRDGFDEFSIFDKTDYVIYKNGTMEKGVFDPSSINSTELDPQSIICHSKEKVLEETYKILEGQDDTPARAVALNAGVALYILEKVPSIEEGYKKSLQQLISGNTGKYFTHLLANGN